ncbi:MAG: hypothetical protein WAM91_08170 [Candidatus Acidiferrales bacterium]
MNPRAPISELMLTASPNLRRALKREQKKGAPLTPAERDEIAQLNELIGLSLRACKRGNTRGGKRNPAVANLMTFVKLRKMLMEGRGPEEKSSQDLLAEVDALLKGPN